MSLISLQIGLDWGLWDKEAQVQYFFSATKPQLYAFQYIYCNYCKNLNPDLRATTQFGVLRPLLFFFFKGKWTKLINCFKPRHKICFLWKRRNDHGIVKQSLCQFFVAARMCLLWIKQPAQREQRWSVEIIKTNKPGFWYARFLYLWQTWFCFSFLLQRCTLSGPLWRCCTRFLKSFLRMISTPFLPFRFFTITSVFTNAGYGS